MDGLRLLRGLPAHYAVLAVLPILASACADSDEPPPYVTPDAETLDTARDTTQPRFDVLTPSEDVASPEDAADAAEGTPEVSPDALPDADVTPDTPSDGSGDAGCDAPLSLCGEACLDLTSDESACGACDNACATGEVCINGGCICGDGLTRCSGSCVTIDSDPRHCGGCDLRCGEGSVCADGACRLDCPDGLTECDAACLDLTRDPLHCGACGSACEVPDNAIASCIDSVCQSACAPSFYDLDGIVGCEYACDGRPGAEERCDGVDNDCNGLVDAADPAAMPDACPLSAGACAGATRPCDATSECSDADYALAAQARGERFAADEIGLCDGVDNDCDGEVDEGCCGRDITLALNEIEGTYPLDDWFVSDARTARIGDRYAHAYVANDILGGGSNGAHIGELAIVDEAVESVWRSEIPRHFGDDVLAVGAGRSEGASGLRWLTHFTDSVSEGETDADGRVVSPFDAAPFGTPAPGQVVDVSVSADGTGYGVVTRTAGTGESVLTLYDWVDETSEWTTYRSSTFDRIDALSLLSSTNGLRACAQTTLDGERYVRCWRMTPEGAFDYEQVIGRSAAEGTPQRGLPFGDGVAMYYDTYGPPCPGFCLRTIRRAVLDASGEINTSVLPFTSTSGAVRVYPGPNGEHWLLALDASASADFIEVTYTLHREGAEGFTRVATMTGNAPVAPAGLVFDDTTVWLLMSTLDLTDPDAGEAGQRLYPLPFAHDGAALCGSHLAD